MSPVKSRRQSRDKTEKLSIRNCNHKFGVVDRITCASGHLELRAKDMSANSSLPLIYHCTDSTYGVIFITFGITKNLLLLPLSIFVFYLAHERWRRQGSSLATSHSDFFTYHLVAMELTGCVFFVLLLCGFYANLTMLVHVSLHLCNMAFPAEAWFHILTCMERYLAVVHPITYLNLRQSKVVRNIIVVCVWLLCFGWSGVTTLYELQVPIIPYFFSLSFSVIVVSFCSLSVLCVLIRPGPGEGGGERKRVDQSKRRAFHTVMAIMGVLWLWFTGYFVCLGLDASALLSYNDSCSVLIFGLWFGLPSSLVLPLLFLHRAGKLPCNSVNTD